MLHKSPDYAFYDLSSSHFVTNLISESVVLHMGTVMIYVKTFLGLMFLSHATFASLGPQTHHGTGQYYANAPCPYDQSTLPAQVLSRSERIRDEAASINARLETARRRVGEIESDRVFSACRSSVNAIIRKACGGDSSEARGEQGVDMFEDHMRGTLLISRNLNYFDSYQVVYQGIMTSKMNMDRAVAGTCPCGYDVVTASCSLCPDEIAVGDWDDGSWDDDKAVGGVDVRPDTPIVPPASSSCFDFAKNDGVIDSQICFSTNETNNGIKQNCRSCLRPSGAYMRGLYPTKFKEYFELQQEVARLERDHRSAVAKAACVETHIDNAPSTGPSADAYRRCIQEADPVSTAADYCLFCDESGRTPQRDRGFDLNRWGPSLLTAGAWILGGVYANNQINRTREGNWEAGYPSDDRQPVVMTNYVMNGFGQVVNSLQSAGAFGCAPSAGVNGQGQVSTGNGIGGMLSGLFGGNANVQVGGAMGYPGGMLGGQGQISGGVFNGNPNAGPWASGNLNGSIDAQRAAIAQAQANLEILQRQNQQRIEGLNALASLQVTLQGLEQQNASTNQQIAEIQAQANGIYAGLNANGGLGGAGYGQGQTGAGLRIGLDVSGYAGLNGGFYGGGAPGTQFPPTSPQYNGPGSGIPNNTGSNNPGGYNPGSGSPNSGLAVPSLGL